MDSVDDNSTPVPLAAASDQPPSEVHPEAYLAKVYRDFPALRALILRRVGDPEAAADILQDAAVTTLEKLRSGDIASPENVGGYLYRVALNHLRNHVRKDRAPVSSSDDLETLANPDGEPAWEFVERRQWAVAARRMLRELPGERDRDLLMRFYLNDEDKERICEDLQLSDEHFNRVIFRARNRFRELLQRRGFEKSDLLTIAAISLGLAGAAQPAADSAFWVVNSLPTSHALLRAQWAEEP
jgi:RNA polymerase sigma-70 factor (ECF subfamily)